VLLERADSLEKHVGNRSFGKPEYVQGRVDGLRKKAAELVMGLPDA